MLGNRDKRDAGAALLRTEVDRLEALSVPQLAGEILTTVFGDGGPGANGSAVTIADAANAFITSESSWSNDNATRDELVRVAGEGLQALEHGSQIVSQIVLTGHESVALGWKLTRAGEATLRG